MQGLPQPADQPGVEGCPIVELSDDAADVKYLLKALYIPTFHCQNELPLAVVGAFIRLGRKYDIKYLYDSAVARLLSRRPTTIEEYEEAMHSKLNPHKPTVKSSPDLAFDIVALASENNVLCNSLDDLFDKLSKEDGTAVSLLHLRRFVVGRERLLTMPANCRRAREAVLAEYLNNAWVGALETPNRAIRPCDRHIHKSMAAGRAKIWEELPEIFGLPPWSELTNGI
ncbi:hypothetical protein B0H14DRAFT_2904245 [Mycena olivaceomarginata]|nr:hypothetical protein B0H14DRAFT_2904245 [Mycena olivaceomarginata]